MKIIRVAFTVMTGMVLIGCASSPRPPEPTQGVMHRGAAAGNREAQCPAPFERVCYGSFDLASGLMRCGCADAPPLSTSYY